MVKPDDCHIDGKRRGHEPQPKGMHTSNEESATVTISEDSQGPTKEEQGAPRKEHQGKRTTQEMRTDHVQLMGMRNPPLRYCRRVQRKGERKIKKCRKATITTRAEVEKTGKTAKRTEGKRTMDHRMDEKETA